ncbi:MAG: CPBP family glutamic-type intramembrane protease [Intrasporangium sp.]|uniref:CPBP family glutamic-type intramembrane protease n=1 Tax=Intrasporangium sp. TaxID=1925024 RepID=UPI002649A9E4|nr:CPBP family glutamic-type intramembrane protease [Intrasporangium sp.]MDN5794548.1 CPBP family glutamic-type intramembrane protease [Intrasporangium sp.]
MTILDTTTQPSRPTTNPTSIAPSGSDRPFTPVLVVAADHRIRTALSAIVTATAHLELTGRAASGIEARDLLAHDRRRHVVIVDLDVPVTAGPLALIADLAQSHVVIALTARHAVTVSARSAGAVASVSTIEEVECAMSWATWHSAVRDAKTDEPTRRSGSAPDRVRPRSSADLTAVLLAAFLPPWAFWFSAIAHDAGLIGWRLPQGAALWSMFLPLVAVVAWRFGRPGLRDLASRVTRWKVPVRAYAAALLAPLVIGASAVGAARALGAGDPTGQVLAAGPALGYLVTGTGVFLLTEELAWRGVLLPRFLARWSPWHASLVLGLVWAAWHLPLLQVRSGSDAGAPVLGFLLLVVATSVLMTAVVGLGRGSVLVAALAHAALDASYSWFGVVGPDHRVFWSTVALTSLAAVALVVATGGRLWTNVESSESPVVTPR